MSEILGKFIWELNEKLNIEVDEKGKILLEIVRKMKHDELLWIFKNLKKKIEKKNFEKKKSCDLP